MSEVLTESVQRLVLMEADLSRLLESSEEESDGLSADHFIALMTRLIANQRQIIETVVAMSGAIAELESAAVVRGS